VDILAPETYRPNVAIFVINESGLLLACERSDLSDTWQIPQGGIDLDESLENAMYRELEEEIGTREVKILARYPESIRYEWPPELYSRGYRGQEQFYFLVRLQTSLPLVFDNHMREFNRAEWISAGEFLKRISGFKSEAYAKALKWFRETYPSIIAD